MRHDIGIHEILYIPAGRPHEIFRGSAWETRYLLFDAPGGPLPDDPAVRGQVRAVRYLVDVEEVAVLVQFGPFETNFRCVAVGVQFSLRSRIRDGEEVLCDELSDDCDSVRHGSYSYVSRTPRVSPGR